MFKMVRKPEYLLSCDWCYEQVQGNPGLPEGWKAVQADVFGEQPGWQLHWCPECIEKIKKLRVNNRPLYPT